MLGCLGNHDIRRMCVVWLCVCVWCVCVCGVCVCVCVCVCVYWWGILWHLHPVPHLVVLSANPACTAITLFVPGITLLLHGRTMGCLSLIIFSG